jgi:hypothetical protein
MALRLALKRPQKEVFRSFREFCRLAPSPPGSLLRATRMTHKAKPGTAILQRTSVRLALLPLLLASCRVTPQSLANVQKAQEPERLVVVYRAHPVSGSMFSSMPTAGNSPIRQASAETSSVMPFHNMCWAKAELRIESPHPDGRPEMARATLHCLPVDCGHECESRTLTAGMEERSGARQARRATFRERWFLDENARHDGEIYLELDLKKYELDRILDELNEHGFFKDQSSRQSPGLESQLEVRLNRRCTSKVWSFEPTLDELMTRVQEQGVQRTVANPITDTHDNGLWGSLRPAAHSR